MQSMEVVAGGCRGSGGGGGGGVLPSLGVILIRESSNTPNWPETGQRSAKRA